MSRKGELPPATPLWPRAGIPLPSDLLFLCWGPCLLLSRQRAAEAPSQWPTWHPSQPLRGRTLGPAPCRCCPTRPQPPGHCREHSPASGLVSIRPVGLKRRVTKTSPCPSRFAILQQQRSEGLPGETPALLVEPGYTSNTATPQGTTKCK